MLDDLAAAYAQALAAVADAFVEAFLAALGLIDLSDPAAVKAAEPGMRSLVVKHRQLAAQAANAFLDASAAEHGVEAYHPPVEPYHASALRKLLRENVGASAEQLAAAARRHVVMAGHRQMMRAVLDPEFGNYATREEQEELERATSPLTAGDESDDEAPAGGGKVRPVGWARVLQGRWSCGFCIMLAARGAVYSSADAAQLVAAEAGKKSREGGFLSRRARTELRKNNRERSMSTATALWCLFLILRIGRGGLSSRGWLSSIGRRSRRKTVSTRQTPRGMSQSRSRRCYRVRLRLGKRLSGLMVKESRLTRSIMGRLLLRFLMVRSCTVMSCCSC